LFLSPKLTVHAQTIYVGSTRTYTTIQAGIDSAADGDTVIVDSGIYTGPGNRDIEITGKSITVRSNTGPENCIIDCQGTDTELHRGFNFSNNMDVNSVIDGFTVINGYVNYGSAGIDCRNNQNSPLTISNCIIRNNTAFGRGGGGGISVLEGIYFINNCTISDNTAGNFAYGGGGIYCNNSNFNISNCTISGNSAGEGGAIISVSSNTNIKNCTISGNFAHNGGGINIRYSNSDISNCVIRGNSADYYGGGICFQGSNPDMKNCTISGNSAGNGGGGIYCKFSTPNIKNCTISGNSADDNGDGMYNYKSEPFLTNCILWGNYSSQIYNDTSTPVINYCCIQDWLGGGTGNFGDDPLLAPDGFHLQPGSPCINAGDPSADYTGQTDIDGQPRVMAGRVDTGADEIALTFVALEIAGPAQVKSNSQNQYNANAYCADGDTYDATNFVLWWVEPQTFAAIDQNGVLTTGQTDSPQDITVYTQYTENDITLETEFTVQILPPRKLHVPAEYDTIQAAIDAAEYREIVLVADGIYTGDGNRDLDFKNKSITVKSQNGPENCTIDCNGTQTEQHRGFNFYNNQNVNAIIDGFTIINGYTQYGGAGIACRKNTNSTLTISNCSVRNNTAVSSEYGSSPFGGGISIIYGICFINNCTISDNSAVDGGGIYCYNSNSDISNCTISNNSTIYHGGGICCDFSNPDIKNCTFSGNTAQGSAGAIYFYSSSPTLINCTFSDNSADYNGGGIKNDDDSNPTLTNCIFTGNTAQWGGGMQNGESSPMLINCTFSGNSARH
jgi:parallel beta-helix repeat protein